MLDLIERFLKVEGFRLTRLDGSMTRQKRESNLDEFVKNPSFEIFLVSLGSGNLGLNLTVANKLFLMDPCA